VVWLLCVPNSDHRYSASAFPGIRSGGELCFGEAEEGRHGAAAEAGHEVELAAVVGFVLGHGPQPLPSGHLGTRRVQAGRQQVGVTELAEDGQGFGVAAVQVGTHAVQARREVGPVARVHAGSALHVFRVHEPLQPRQVAEQVAEAEGPRGGCPLQVLGRERLQHPHRAGPGVAPVGEEGGGVLEHGGVSQEGATIRMDESAFDEHGCKS